MRGAGFVRGAEASGLLCAVVPSSAPYGGASLHLTAGGPARDPAAPQQEAGRPSPKPQEGPGDRRSCPRGSEPCEAVVRAQVAGPRAARLDAVMVTGRTPASRTGPQRGPQHSPPRGAGGAVGPGPQPLCPAGAGTLFRGRFVRNVELKESGSELTSGRGCHCRAAEVVVPVTPAPQPLGPPDPWPGPAVAPRSPRGGRETRPASALVRASVVLRCLSPCAWGVAGGRWAGAARSGWTCHRGDPGADPRLRPPGRLGDGALESGGLIPQANGSRFVPVVSTLLTHASGASEGAGQTQGL